MLKDSRSYEVQIIDAVRSVNKALGGTYGTSSAIGKTEFNQYEVQLIDAIRGIGRTLSSKGLSLVGGGVGEVTAEQFQALSKRVSKLEQESFFRLVDGNITLKQEYQNLWVPGWLAAGGIGNGGGGGGGATHLYELEDVYHGTETVLRADGTTPAQPGDSLVYDSTHGWLAAPGGGSVTVVDNLTSSSTTNALSANQGRTIKSIIDAGYVFKGFLHPEDSGTAVCDYPVCYLTGISGAYYGYGPLNVNLNDGELALIYREKNSSTWNYKTTTISGSGGGGSYSAGTGISISNNVISLKTASTSQLGGVKVDGTTITISNGVISSVGGSGGGYIGMNAVQSTSQAQYLFGIPYINATSSASSSSRIVWESGNNAWHFYGNIYADGWVAAGGIGSGGGGGSTVVVTPILTSGTPIATISVDGSPTTLYAPSGGGGGGGISSVSLTTGTANGTLRLIVDGVTGSNVSVYGLGSMAYMSSLAVGDIPDLSSLYLPLAGGTMTGNITMNGANIVPQTTGTCSVGSSTKRFGDFYGVNADLSGDLSLASTSHIDIGPLRLAYDNNSKALHITKVSSSDTNTYGIYADGFVAAGGAGQSS